MYLSDIEFFKVFSMTRDEFLELEEGERRELKKEANLLWAYGRGRGVCWRKIEWTIKDGRYCCLIELALLNYENLMMHEACTHDLSARLVFQQRYVPFFVSKICSMTYHKRLGFPNISATRILGCTTWSDVRIVL